jgi:hypothetical protein
MARELGNRRSSADISRRIPGNRVPGALYEPAVLRAGTNAREVSQESLESEVGAIGGSALYTDDLGVDVQEYAAALEAFAAGELQLGVQSITATASLGTNKSIVLADATSGAITLNLPAASSNNGRQVTVKKTDASVNAVTVDGSGGETIDGSTTYALPAQNDYVTILCDGTGWQVTGSGP